MPYSYKDSCEPEVKVKSHALKHAAKSLAETVRWMIALSVTSGVTKGVNATYYPILSAIRTTRALLSSQRLKQQQLQYA